MIILNGSTQIFVDNKKESLHKGDLFIAFPHQIHYYENCAPEKYLVVILSPHIFYDIANVLQNTLPQNNIIRNIEIDLQNLFLNALDATGTYNQTTKAGLLNQAFALILPDMNVIPKPKHNFSALAEILNYCSLNFTSDITLDILSDELHISKSHISRLLNDKLKLSLNDYLNMLRINYACDLINNSRKKMSDISEEAGFGSIRSFNRAFQKIMNMSPVEYKKTISFQ